MQNYLNNYRNYLTVKAIKGYTPFYANEVNLSGVDMISLNNNGFIKPTGVTKEVEICIYQKDIDKPNAYIKVPAKEWVIADTEEFMTDYYPFGVSTKKRKIFTKELENIRDLITEILKLENETEGVLD